MLFLGISSNNDSIDKSFISFFYKDEHMIDLKKGTMITDRQIIGAMTSRPLNVLINITQNSSNHF